MNAPIPFDQYLPNTSQGGHTEERSKEDGYKPMDIGISPRPSESSQSAFPFCSILASKQVTLTHPNMAIGIQIAAIGAGFNLISGFGNRPSFASNMGAR